MQDFGLTKNRGVFCQRQHLPQPDYLVHICARLESPGFSGSDSRASSSMRSPITRSLADSKCNLSCSRSQISLRNEPLFIVSLDPDLPIQFAHWSRALHVTTGDMHHEDALQVILATVTFLLFFYSATIAMSLMYAL